MHARIVSYIRACMATHTHAHTHTRTHTHRAKSTEAQRQTLNPEWAPNTLPFLNIVTVDSTANFRVEVRDEEIAIQSYSTVMLTGSIRIDRVSPERPHVFTRKDSGVVAWLRHDLCFCTADIGVGA